MAARHQHYAGDQLMTAVATTDKPRLYLVVPAFNEADNLERLFGSFGLVQTEYHDRFDVRFLLVDDGSTDQTADKARELGEHLQLTVLESSVNRGPGNAFAMAF